MTKRTCVIDGCDEPHMARGWCKRHYDYHRRAGLLAEGQSAPELSVLDRLRRYFFPSGSERCWLWTGALDKYGYGYVSWRQSGKKRHFIAHRLIYEELVGPIPDGLVIDHLCRVRHCVNPNHLEPVTQDENLRRAREATK